jgi:hypothetical protein
MNGRHSLSTFDGFCAGAKCTPSERDKLAWHLACYRAKKTYEGLRYEPDAPR